jgi:hypothetical protein
VRQVGVALALFPVDRLAQGGKRIAPIVVADAWLIEYPNICPMFGPAAKGSPPLAATASQSMLSGSGK